MPTMFRSLMRWLGVFVVVVMLVSPAASSAGSPCWKPPVEGWVIDPFREPACPWCAGNRGIDFGISGLQAVRAVAAGTVTFAGTVAGTRYVIVQDRSGWKLTYGKLAAIDVSRGDRVVGGAVLGSVRHEFFFGLRVADVYRDPAPYLGDLRGRPRLIPVDGSEPRPSPAGYWVCI